MKVITVGGVASPARAAEGARATCLPPTSPTELVLQNNVIVGSVNANRRHFYKAAATLATADCDWLGRLISRRGPPDRIADALQRGPDDIKVVVDFTGE